MAKKTVRPFTFLTSILLSLTAASVNAWVWPGDIVTSAEEGRYPGLAVRAMGEGILAVHSGTLLSVSEDLVVLDHGNGIWGLYFYSGTSETVWALRRGMDSSFLTADTIVPSELLTIASFISVSGIPGRNVGSILVNCYLPSTIRCKSSRF